MQATNITESARRMIELGLDIGSWIPEISSEDMGIIRGHRWKVKDKVQRYEGLEWRYLRCQRCGLNLRIVLSGASYPRIKGIGLGTGRIREGNCRRRIMEGAIG